MSEATVPVRVERPAPHQDYPAALTIVALMFVGTLVSLLWFLHTPSNYQERFNLSFALHGSLSVITGGSPDNPMPLYYWLLHGLAHVFTPSLTVLRLISLVSYLLTLPAIYFTGKLATGDKRSGMLAAILLGLSPFMLWYAMRGTMYAPLVLMTVLNQLCFLLVLRKKAWAWPLYVLTAATGLGLHYFFITLLVLQWWFYFIKRREYSRTHKLLMAGSAAALLIGYVLWMHYLSDAIHIFAALPYAGKPSATNAFIIFVQYLFGFQSVTTITFVIAFWPLLVIVALLAVQKYARPPAGIQYATFTAVALILGVFILSWIWRSLFLASYLIIGLPAFFLLVSWYLVALELNILAWARTALVVVMAVMLLIELLHPVRAVNEDYLGSLALPRSTLLLH